MDNPLEAVIQGGRLAQPWEKPLSPDDLLNNPIAAMMAKPSDKASLAVDTALRQGKPWEEVEGQVRDLGVDPSHFRQGYKLESARKRIEGQGVSELRSIAVQSLPFGDFGDVRGTGAYSEAQKRFQEGKASDEDIETIAKYEEEQAGFARVNQTLGGKILSGVAGVPKMVGEFYLGGKILKGLGAAGRGMGILKAAPHPPMLAAMNPGFAGQVRSHAGRMAILLPTQSGMYVEQAKQNNLAAGREADDIRGYPTALGHGYASLLVLGSLQNRLPSWVPQPGMAGRMAAKGVVGTGEMAGVDAAFGVADEFIKDDAWKFKTGYGTIGHLVQGIRSGDGEMVKHALYDATATALTFSIFAGLHDHGPAGPFNKKAADGVMQNYGELLAAYKRKGLTPELAARAIDGYIGRVLRAQKDNPDLTSGEAKGLFENAPDEIRKPLLEMLDRALPERPKAAEQRGVMRALTQREGRPVGPMEADYAIARSRGTQPGEAFEGATGRLAEGAETQIPGSRNLAEPPPETQAPVEPIPRAEKSPQLRSEPEGPPEPSPTPEVPPAATSAGSSRPAEAEPVYHVAGWGELSKSVDSAISMLGDRGVETPGGNLDVWTDPVKANPAGTGYAVFVFDPARSPDRLDTSRGNKGIASLKGPEQGKLRDDPALAKVVYKGSWEDPGYARLEAAIHETNARRIERGLPPIAIEPTRPKPPVVESKSPEWQAAYERWLGLVDDATARSLADKDVPDAATVEPAAEPVKPETAEIPPPRNLPAEPPQPPQPNRGKPQPRKPGERTEKQKAMTARNLEKMRKGKVEGREDWTAEEERIRLDGGGTIGDWIRGQGGIRESETSLDTTHIRQSGMHTLFRDRGNRPGQMGADALAQMAYDRGWISEPTEDALLRAVEQHLVVEGEQTRFRGKSIEDAEAEHFRQLEEREAVEQRKLEEQEAATFERLKQEALESLATAGVEPGEDIPFAPPPEGTLARMRERQAGRGPQPVRPGAGRPPAKQQPAVDRHAALDELVRELPPSAGRGPVRDALESLTDLNMRNAGLDYRERYIINQRLLGRPQQNIAKDRKQIGFDRRSGKDYSREYIRQIEGKALAKLGESASIAFRQKAQAAEEAARLQERQGELAVGELTGAAEGEGRKQRSLKWYEVVENDMMALNDRWVAERRDGTLTPEKEAEYRRELQRLMLRYDRGVAAEGPPPPPATAGGTGTPTRRPAPNRGRPDQQTLFGPGPGGSEPQRPKNLFDFMEERQVEREARLAEAEKSGGEEMTWQERLRFNGVDLSDAKLLRESWGRMDSRERVEVAAQVGAVYQDANSRERGQIRKAFIDSVPDATVEGSIGDTEPFNAALHDSGDQAIMPGELVAVKEPAIMLVGYLPDGGGRYLVGRAVVARAAETGLLRDGESTAGKPKTARPKWANESGLKEVIDAYDGAQGRTKEAIEGALLNSGFANEVNGKIALERNPYKDAEPGEMLQRLGVALASAHDYMHRYGQDTAPIERALEAIGAEREGSPGEVIPFNPSVHEDVPGLSSGSPVKVLRSGWAVPRDGGGFEVVTKAKVQPAASGDALASPPPGQADQIPGSRNSEEPVLGDMEFLATARKEIGLPEQVEKTPPYVRDAHRGVYLGKEEAVVTGKMMVGDVPRGLHEIAHHISLKNKFPLDPARLPPQVRLGFKQFDYDPARPMGRTAMQEGFAEWFRRRTTGSLENLTHAQQAAAKYAERLIAEAGLTEYVDRQRARWDRLTAASAESRASKLMSGTGEATGPQLSVREAASETTRNLIHDANEQITDDLAVLRQMWDEAQANRKAQGMKPLPETDNPAVKAQMLMFAAKPLAGDFAQNGVKTIVDGHWQKIGLSVDEIVAGAKPEWIAPVDGGPSRAGLYAATRHILSEAEKHGMLAPRHPHLPPKTVQSGPAKGQEIWEAMDRLVVPEHELRIFREAMEEMQADREFAQWAEGFADRLTAAFNSTRRALASKDIHRLDPEVVRYYEELRPDYVEIARVITNDGWKKSAYAGGRGERVKKLIHARSGTGEPIVDPLVSYHKRLLLTANALTDQIKKNALANLLQQPGMGKYGTFFEAEGVAPAGQARADLLRDLGMEEAGALDALRALGIERGEILTNSKPWPTDGTKPTLEWTGPDGRLTSIRINDRRLYDLATGQQADSSQIARVFNVAARLGFTVPGYGRFEPLAWAGSVLKLGATGTNLAFQFRNIPRDMYAFWGNTIDRLSVGELPRAYLTAYKGMIQSLMGHKPTDRLFQWFLDNRGDQMRQHAFDASAPSAKNLISKRSIWGVMKDALGVLGAGELAPRYLEAVNALRKATGKTKAELIEMLEAADAKGDGRDPIPFHLGLEVLNAANEVTTPFSRLGVTTRQINKLTPFFGPTIAGLSKVARNWRDNPKGAAFAMSALLGLRAVYWAAVSDEDWWQELSAYDRYNNFVVPVGDALYRLPGPRDVGLAGGGVLTAMLDAAADKNPDFKGLFRQSLDEVIPPAPIPTPGRVAWDIQGNEDFLGRPIVPRRAEGLPWLEKFTEYTGPYIAKQMTGGQSEAVLGIKIPEVRSARRSVDEYYERLKSLEGERTVALRAGRPYANEKEYQKLHRIESQMTAINQRLRGEMKRGRRLVAGERPSEEEARKLRARQTELARRALGK